MVKDKILNQWQRSNISILDPMTVAMLKKGSWRDSPSGICRCVHCGRHSISNPIIAYYNYFGERLLCHVCQRLIHASVNAEANK